MNIPILMLPSLQAVIDPKDYVPAYDGESVGLDLYACSDVTVPAHVEVHVYSYYTPPEEFNVWIPTGLKVAIPHGYVGLIKERGSIGPSPFIVRAGVIDPGFSSEVKINCVNISAEDIAIGAGEKLPFQLIVAPVENQFEFIDEETFHRLHENSRRQGGMVGSSD